MMIMINQNNIYLGGIKTDEQAARFYDKVAIISQGINAKTNFEYSAQEIIQIMKQFDFTEETEIIKFKAKPNSGSDTLIQINISSKEEQSGGSKEY